jgi:hypothetical protein
MRARRLTTFIIKILIALLIVLLIGFVPLQELLYPTTLDDTAKPTDPSPIAPIPIPTQTPFSPLERPAPTSPGPLVEIAEPIWVANRADGTILRIDTNLGQVADRVSLEGKIGPVTAGESGVWAALTSGLNQSSIVHLDLHDLSIAATIPIYAGKITSLQAGAGAVWVGIERSPLDQINGGNLLRIDPITNEVNAVIPRPGTPVEIAIYANTIWLLEQQDGVMSIGRLEKSSLQVTTFPIAELNGVKLPSYTHLSLGAAGIWVTAFDQNTSLLYQIDPSNGAVLEIVDLGSSSEGYPAALMAGDTDVLVWLSDGSLLQFDPLLMQVANRTVLKPGFAKIHLAPGAIWIENETEAELYRLDAAFSRVATVLSTGAKPAPTPLPTPTLAPGAEPECDARYPSRLLKGGTARVKEDPPLPNRVRIEPDAQSEVIGRIEPGEIVNLVDGPVCKHGWVWWYVQSRKSGLTGWTSEGDRNEYWLAPVE